jgi:hypothetical protein
MSFWQLHISRKSCQKALLYVQFCAFNVDENDRRSRLHKRFFELLLCVQILKVQKDSQIINVFTKL